MHIYDPHKAPLLDHYRSDYLYLRKFLTNGCDSLKVPAVRSVLDYIKYILLFGRKATLSKSHTIQLHHPIPFVHPRIGIK